MQQDGARPATLRQMRAPLVVLVIGLVATLIAAALISRMESDREQARFEALTDSVVDRIEARLSEQRLLLRGVAALFQASGEVSRDEFTAYVTRLKLPQNHPGVLGVGFAVRVQDPDMLARVIVAARRDGVDLKPWPDRPGGPGSAILYLDPLTPVNRRALGFDMYGEPIRRQAMAAALESGRATLSGKVTLVQDRGEVPGFLLYVPIGSVVDAPPGSAASAMQGWAYSPLRAQELFGSALMGSDLDEAGIAIFDGPAAPANLLYRRSIPSGEAALTGQRVLDFAGRRWTIEVAARSGFFQAGPLPSFLLVVLGGTLVTLLLAVLALQQSRSVARTEEKVRLATQELRQANEALISAAEARDVAEAKIRQMQKIEAVGQLTGGIAHDFNNMLAVVLGNLDLAERRRDQPDRLARALGAAKEGAARAAELTRRLLAFGRQQALTPRVLDANQLVSGMSDLLRRTLGETVRLHTELSPDLWRTAVDPGQLENALLNLAINSRDAMPEGGILAIETSNDPLGPEDLRLRDGGAEPGDYVLIKVSDTGLGMSEDVRERALDPFFTTKAIGKGTGLGLSQVYGFVKQSAGHMHIDSAEGRGTSVLIHLPRALGEVVQGAAAVERADLPSGRAEELILVVEDEEGVRSITVESLRDLGYTVIHAPNGQEALALLDRHGGAALLFTDMVMPGMSGLELARQARRRFPQLRILYTTGYSPDAIATEGGSEPQPALINKPFSAAQLAGKVRDVLDADTPTAKG